MAEQYKLICKQHISAPILREFPVTDSIKDTKYLCSVCKMQVEKITLKEFNETLAKVVEKEIVKVERIRKKELEDKEKGSKEIPEGLKKELRDTLVKLQELRKRKKEFPEDKEVKNAVKDTLIVLEELRKKKKTM